MKVFITGSNGQLGQELQKNSSNFNYELIPYDYPEGDITNLELLDKLFSKNKFDILINCAAYTAVDLAEKEQQKARNINVLGARNLALQAKKRNFRLIHISTDFVFDGTAHSPYDESHPTKPLNFYGQSKLEGEKEIRDIAPNSIIIRTSWLYSSFGKNFVKTILRLAKEREELKIVVDQIGSPTYAGDLALALLTTLPQLKQKTDGGLYHFSNLGVTSWFDFAKHIIDTARPGKKINLVPIRSSEYPTPAKRPHYSSLDCKKFQEEFKFEIPYWKDSLETCVSFLN